MVSAQKAQVITGPEANRDQKVESMGGVEMPGREKLWKLVALLVVVTLAVPLAGCGAKATPTAPPPYQAKPTPTPEPPAPPTASPEPTKPAVETVKIAYVPILAFAAAYAADGQGYFKEYGLDVQFESVKSGTEAVAFLAEGQVDVGAIAVVASTWNAFAKGLDLRIVAPAALKLMKDDPSAVLLVRKDLWESGAVKTAADLKGRTVGVAGGPGSGGEYLVAKCLEPVGLTIFDVNLQNIGNADMAAAMEAKAVDAVLTGSPYSTAIIEAGTGVPLVKDMTPGAMTMVYVYSGKFMKERPEVAKRFMLALMKGARSLQGEGFLSDANVAAYMKYMKTTEETIRKTPPGLYDPNLTVKIEDLADIQNTHMKNGRLEYSTPLPLDNLVDLSWQQYALKELGRWEPPPLSKVETVKIAYVPILAFAAAYAADGQGYFKEYGLDVQFESVKSGTEAVAFLAEGQVDVGAIAVVASTWNAFAKGLDLRIVAPAALKLMKDDPSAVLLVRKDLWESGAVKTAADLKGRTVGVAGGPGSGGEYLVAKCLEPVGLTIFDVNLQNIGNADMAAAMEAKAVDAVLTGSPYSTAIIEAGTGVPLVKDMTPGAMTMVYVYSGKFMKERPEVAKRFMLALMKGARSLQGEGFLSDANVAAYMKYMKTTEETIRKTPPGLYDPNLTVKIEDLADIQNTHMKNGRLEYSTPLPLDNLVDLSWQQYALMILGPYGK